MAATRNPSKPAAAPNGSSGRALTLQNSNSGSQHEKLRSVTVGLSDGSDLGVTSQRVDIADDIEKTTLEPPERARRRFRVWGFWTKRRGDEEAGTSAEVRGPRV